MKKFFKVQLLVIFVFFPAIIALAADTAAAQRHDMVFIISDETVNVMMRTPAASGEKYEALGDPDTVFWSKGDEAMLTIDGKEYSRYVLVNAFSGADADELSLTVDGKSYIMKRAVSASGARYEAVNDPETVLWNKGASVTLTVGGVVYPDYDVWQPFGRIWLPPLTQ